MSKRTLALSRRAVGLLVVLGAILIITGCPWNEPDPNLVMERSAVGAWICMNNTFAMPPDSVLDAHPDTLYFRTGLLLQIGDYPKDDRFHQKSTRFQFKKVTLSKGNDAPATTLSRPASADTIFWINVVSKYDLSDDDRRFTGAAEPMKTEHVTLLYPGPFTTTHPCYELAAPEKCLRTARINEALRDVLGVITYWQGKNGFRTEAIQTEAAWGNTFKFYFEDPFRVDVYSVTSSNVTKIEGYDYGVIDKIVIEALLDPPQDGEKQDPPWPGLNP